MVMFCKNCGKEIDDNAFVCLGCGAKVQDDTQPVKESNNAVGWGILGFFFPLVGLILCIVWNSSKPDASRASGRGALIGFILPIVFWLILLALYLIFNKPV